MKKFTEGVRRKIELVSACAILLAGSITSVHTQRGNDDKAKKGEAKLANTFIVTDENVADLSSDFKKIAAIVERNSAIDTTIITTTTTTTTTTSTTTTTTNSTTTTAEVTTIIETETIVEEDANADGYVEEEYVEYEDDYYSDYEDEYFEEDNGENDFSEGNTEFTGDITDYVSESDYILLCNAVGHEYGSYWVSVQEKAKVVEVIMNRVNSSRFPDTIYGVLTERYQFSGAWGYVNLGCFSKEVTQSVKDSVIYYFEHPDEYTHGYTGFHGDGYWNYFS